MKWCDYENGGNVSGQHYLLFVIILPVVICLQILWVVDQIGFNYKSLSKIPKHLSSLYVLLQIIGLLYTIHELCKRVILVQVYPSFIFNDIACISTTYLSRLFPFLYEEVLLIQVLLRLTSTFKRSNGKLGITKTNKIGLFTLITVPFIVWIILFFVFLEKPCYAEWFSQFDINGNDGILYFCKAPFQEKKSMLIAILTIIWVSLSNGLIGIVFSYKLHELMSKYSTTNNNDDDSSIQHIMAKNTILTCCISTSTILLWNVILFQFRKYNAILYLDCFFNVFFLGLMFKFNNKLYMKIFYFPHKWLMNRFKTENNKPMELNQCSKTDTNNGPIIETSDNSKNYMNVKS